MVDWKHSISSLYVKKLTKKLIEMSERNFGEKDKTLKC